MISPGDPSSHPQRNPVPFKPSLLQTATAPTPVPLWGVEEHCIEMVTPNLLSPHSGDGYAQNNELTQKPPAVKYRPDQHSSTGTGMALGSPWVGWGWREPCAPHREHVSSTRPCEVLSQQSHQARSGHREQSEGVLLWLATATLALEGAWRPRVRSMAGDGCPTGPSSAQGETPAERCCSPVAPPDVRGLWIYRLDSRSRVNYRLRCLAWLDTQPAPAAWNSQLPPCPCSQPQAELDHRYRRSRGAEHGPPGSAVGWGDAGGLLPLWGCL